MNTPTEDAFSETVRPERRTGRRRKSNGRHSHYSHHHRTRAIYGLGILSVFLFLAFLFVSIKLSLYAKDLNDVTVLFHRQERELQKLRPMVARLEKEIAELVQQRLPGLHPLVFDQLISIDQQYVRNIIFTLIGKEENRQYEYKLTVKNNGLTAVHPIVKILFFDQLGIQVAHSVIGVDERGDPTLDVLERGEVRSYTQVIDLSNGHQAHYFMVMVDLPDYQKLKD